MIRICFVCLGNICRSPTAEAVMKAFVKAEGLESEIEIDSAGTGDWHVGEKADSRTRQAAKERGIEITSRARQFVRDDFERFDMIIAMDRSNRVNIENMAPLEEHLEKVFLFRDFDEESPKDSDVPDPYYGGEDGFSKVLDICEAGCRGLLKYIGENHLDLK